MTNKTQLPALTFGKAYVPVKLRKKFNALLALEKILPEHLKDLKPRELEAFQRAVQEKLNEATDWERDIFMQKVGDLIGAENRNNLWEHNHAQITAAMTRLLLQNGRMPNKSEIAVATGLSRKTVHAHLKNHAENPLYLEREEQLRFMSQQVTATLLRMALKENTKAAKLFLESVGRINGTQVNNTVIKDQHNYIQINKTVLSQQAIEQLKPEQLKDLEEVIIKKLDSSK